MSSHTGRFLEQTGWQGGRRLAHVVVGGRRPVGVQWRCQRDSRRCDCPLHFMNVVNRTTAADVFRRLLPSVHVGLSARENLRQWLKRQHPE